MDAELLVQSLVDYEVASVSQKFLTTMMVHQPISPLWHMRSALQHCWLCDTISDIHTTPVHGHYRPSKRWKLWLQLLSTATVTDNGGAVKAAMVAAPRIQQHCRPSFCAAI